MERSNTPIDTTLVSCDVCLKEVPQSEATVPEAVEYFVYFCGPECYEKWKVQGSKPPERAEKRRE